MFGGDSGGASPVQITDLGVNDTINGLSSALTVTAGATSTGLFVASGSGELTFVGGPGTSTVYGGSGNSSVVGGPGGIVFASNGNDTLNGGAGGATLFGSSGNSVLYTGQGALEYAAGAGNETLNASTATGPVLAFANADPSANDTLILGNNNNTVLAGGGSDTFTGGSGADTFYFDKTFTAGGNDVITDFNANSTIGIYGYGSAQSQASLIATASTGASGVTITLLDNTQITFDNLTNANQLAGHINIG